MVNMHVYGSGSVLQPGEDKWHSVSDTPGMWLRATDRRDSVQELCGMHEKGYVASVRAGPYQEGLGAM